jgi:hypothetical protein
MKLSKVLDVIVDSVLFIVYLVVGAVCFVLFLIIAIPFKLTGKMHVLERIVEDPVVDPLLHLYVKWQETGDEYYLEELKMRIELIKRENPEDFEKLPDKFKEMTVNGS